MARYFFDIRDGSRLVADKEGSEYADLAGVEREATNAAADLSRGGMLSGAPRRIAIEVRDEHGHRVLTATISLEIERSGP